MAIQRRSGKGYKLEPHTSPGAADAVWLTANQVLARYGGRSQMWLWRKFEDDPDFPKPRYDGRLRLYSIAALDAYDRAVLGGSTTAKMKNSPPRNDAQRKADAKPKPARKAAVTS